MLFLRLIALFMLTAAPQYTYTNTDQPVSQILEVSQFTLIDLLVILSKCNAYHTKTIFLETKINNQRLSSHISERLQKANGVWNLGSFIGFCNYADYLEDKVLYAVVYERAKKLVNKSGSCEQKNAFTLLPTPLNVEKSISRNTGFSFKSYHTSSAMRIAKKAATQWSLEEALAYLTISFLHDCKRSSKNPVDNSADTYACIYAYAKKLCATSGTPEQKALFALFCTPATYKEIMAKIDTINQTRMICATSIGS